MISTEPNLGQPIVASGRRRLLGTGIALPGPAINSGELCELISQRFGIKTARHGNILAPRLGVHTRHLCRDFFQAQEAPRAGARNPELAALAVKQALEDAGLQPQNLSYLISHTATPSTLLPAGSAEISRLLRFSGPHAELRQACTGFANALQFAFALTATPDAAPVAIVGVETGSVYFDPACLQTDTSQWINFLQMGDGAAAVIIGPDRPEESDVQRNDLAHWISAAYFGQLQTPPSSGLTLRSGGSDCTTPPNGTLLFEHDFNGVAEHGALLLEAGKTLMEQAGYDLATANFIVPHQASGAVAPWLAERWNYPVEKISNHAQRVGNLGSASIWAALHDYRRSSHVGLSGLALFLGAEATQYSFGGFALET